MNRNRIANQTLFASREEETAAMVALRKEMFTNEEIAAKLGVHYVTVLERIGKQPREITNMNRKLAAKARIDRREAREALKAAKAVEEYNKTAQAANALLIQYAQAVRNLRALQKAAVKASKASGTPLVKLSKAS